MTPVTPPARLRVRPTTASVQPGDEPLDVEPGGGTLRWLDGDRARLATPTRPDGVEVRLERTGRPAGGADIYEVLVDGWRFELQVEDAARAELRERARRGRESGGPDGPIEVRAMIPGRVVSIEVVQGETVALGQPLVVVEAMKMQNELRAPREGVVERVAVAVGRTIEPGDLVVVLG